MTDWTYAHQYVRLDDKRGRKLAILQDRAADGWELVSAVPLGKRARKTTRADVLLLLKRPHSEDSVESANGTAEQPAEPSKNGKRHAKDSLVEPSTENTPSESD